MSDCLCLCVYEYFLQMHICKGMEINLYGSLLQWPLYVFHVNYLYRSVAPEDHQF